MKDLIKIELYKIVKRKDFWLMQSMIFIPIMYAVGLASNSQSFSYEGTSKVSALGYASEMMVFVYMCFIYFIILSACVIRSLKGEIENKSLLLYAQRINDRKKMYISKWIAFVILLFTTVAIFVLVSVVCYELFLLKRPDIASGQLLNIRENFQIVSSVLAIVLCFIFTISVALCLSSWLKSFQAMGVFTFLWLGMMYLKEFAVVKYIAPIYYVENILQANVDGQRMNRLLGLLVLVGIVSIVSYVVGCKKFVRSDL